MKTLSKTIQALAEGTENTIKVDVLSWLEGSEAETLEDAINALENVNCEAGDVSHLVYNNDISTWVYEHEDAILETVNNLAGTDLHDLDDINWSQHDDLSSVLNNWESGESRYDEWRNEVYEEAVEMAEDDNEDWEEMDEDEQQDAINEAIEHLFTQYDVFELTSTDKAILAWLSFVYEAHILSEELEGIREVIEGE